MVATSPFVMCRPAPRGCLNNDQKTDGGCTTVETAPHDRAESMYFMVVCPAGRQGSHRATPGSKASRGGVATPHTLQITDAHSHLQAAQHVSEYPE